MRRGLKWAGLGLLAALAVSQFVRPARTNPPVDPAIALAVEPPAGAILERSCMDCHTNRTVWPWYSNVAPISWLLVNDVNKGREELNFSQWGQYPPKKQAKLLRETCEEAREGEMPPAIYLVLHPASKLGSADTTALCSWVDKARRQLSAAAVTGEAAAEKEDDDD